MDVEALKQFSPFDGLQEDYLHEALDHIAVEELTKGQILFKRGRANARRYFLLSGRVELIDSQYQAFSVRAGGAGNTTLNPESPTKCSCVAKDTNVSVFSIEAETLDRLTAWSESAESAFEAENSAVEQHFDPTSTGQFDVATVEDELSNDWMSSLLRSPLFSRVPLTLVQDLFAKFEDIEVKQGQIILKEGEVGDFFYVIASGRFNIANRSGSIDVEVGPGQHFGEEALLGNTLRNATIKASENGMLKRLNADDFQALLSEPVLEYRTFDALVSMKQNYKLVDVKMPLEYRAFHIGDAINIPLSRLRNALPDLATRVVYAVPDDCGSRAKIAVHLLCQFGFEAYILQSPEALLNEAS